MIIGGAVSEDHMVSEFLKAEIKSGRWGGYVAARLAQLGETPTIITAPDVLDEAENRRRAAVLEFRGYATRQAFFQGFPDDVDWRTATITRQDCLGLRLLKDYPWLWWTDAARRAEDAAATIVRGEAVGPNGLPDTILLSSITAIRAQLRAAQPLPPVVLVKSPSQPEYVIMEGHGRVMAAILNDALIELPALIGTSPRMSSWCKF